MEQSEKEDSEYELVKMKRALLNEPEQIKQRARDILSKQYDELQAAARVLRASGRRGSDSSQFMQESLLFRDAVSLCRAIFNDKTFYDYDTDLITIKREL